MGNKKFKIIKLFICIFSLNYFLLHFYSCSLPSKNDIEKLSLLNEKFGENYAFELKNEFYLKVQIIKDMEIDENELRVIYKIFFFDDLDGKIKKRNTSFVYLNCIDYKGKFQFQISYDFITNNFVKSYREYY